MPSAFSPPTAARPSPASLHPLDQLDRPVIERLLAVSQPTDADLVDAARLIARYRDTRLSPDLRDSLRQVLRNWGLNLAQLQERTRAIWASGWRPQLETAQEPEVGSGADVEG